MWMIGVSYRGWVVFVRLICDLVLLNVFVIFILGLGWVVFWVVIEGSIGVM